MTNKIPFDAELWKSGKYDVVNEEGIVRSITMHEVECKYPISVVSANRSMETYTAKGFNNVDLPTHPKFNLYLTPKKRKVWVAVHKRLTTVQQTCSQSASFYITSPAYESEEKLINDVVIGDQYHIIEVELPEDCEVKDE